jgi:hypothetical protein
MNRICAYGSTIARQWHTLQMSMISCDESQGMCGISTTGELHCYGSKLNDHMADALPLGNSFVSVSANGFSSTDDNIACAISDLGEVSCWVRDHLTAAILC